MGNNWYKFHRAILAFFFFLSLRNFESEGLSELQKYINHKAVEILVDVDNIF